MAERNGLLNRRTGLNRTGGSNPPLSAIFYFNKVCFMYYVYILHLSNNQLYTGYTSDLKRRFQEHQRGKSEFTSQHLPVQLIHYEAYSLESDARRRESFLKTTEGKRLLRQQIRDCLNIIIPNDE